MNLSVARSEIKQKSNKLVCLPFEIVQYQFWGYQDENRVTLELRIFWVFPANPGVQFTNFYS